jgi:hypothetical protein
MFPVQFIGVKNINMFKLIIVMRKGPSGNKRNYIVHCCGSVKCQKSYGTLEGVKGKDWQRNRRFIVPILELEKLKD